LNATQLGCIEQYVTEINSAIFHFAGSNPSTSLMRLAKELRGGTLHVDMVSLGRGQGKKAEELISKAQLLKGRWVYLQNCHLAASWMPRLQAIIDK
jgi:dynein heavy chain, axonemal